jgi:hypothetical protein
MAQEIVRGATILALIVGLKLVGDRLSAASQATGEVRIDLSDVPLTVGEWHGHDVEVEQGVLDVLQPIAMLSRRYEREPDGTKADVWAVYATDWRTIHSPHRCLVAGGWRITDSKAAVTVHTGGLGDARANVYVAEKQGVRIVAAHTFLTSQQASTNYLAQIVRLAFSRGEVNRVACLATVSIATGDRPEEEAVGKAADLLARLTPHLREALLEATTADAPPP